MAITIDEVKGFFESSKDDAGVKAFRDSLVKEAMTEDVIKGYLVTDAGQKLIRSGQVPTIESRVTDAIKSFKDGHYADDLKAAVAAEREKLNPKETDAEKRIRELEEKDAKRERELAKEKLMRSIAEEAANAKVPTSLFKHFGGESIEAARELIAEFQVFAKDIETKAKNGIVTSGVKPGSGDQLKPKPDLVNKSLQQIEREARENATRQS